MPTSNLAYRTKTGINGEHVGMGYNGKMVTIERCHDHDSEEKTDPSDKWIAREEGDVSGDQTATYPTLKLAKICNILLT